jgi:hypothetical protein
MYQEVNLPVAMTASQAAALLDGVRNPRIMRWLVERPLNELVQELLRADVNRNPAPEIYVEHHVVGLITALQPMLKASVAAFFQLSDGERAQRRQLLERYNLAIPD